MNAHGDGDPDIAVLSVLHDDGTADPARDPGLSPDLTLRMYREMRRLRMLDERMTALQRQGRVGFYGAARGQEAVPVAAALTLRDGDWVFPALREQGVMLVRGFPLRTFVAQLFGNAGDVLKGRQMPSHHSARAVGQVSWSSCVGTQLPHAVGAAWAMRARKTGAVAVAFLGDGATSHGDFHAAMNFAGVWRVPCVLVCQNNQWAISVPVRKQTASPTIAIKGHAYGIPGVRVDGNDALAVYTVVRDAVERARSGGGPTLVEAVTYRTGAHSTSDDPSRYQLEAEVAEWSAKDPLDRLRRHLVRLGLLEAPNDAVLDESIAAEIAAAVHEVEAMPPLQLETLVEDVYAEIPWHLRRQLEELKKVAVPPRQD